MFIQEKNTVFLLFSSLRFSFLARSLAQLKKKFSYRFNEHFSLNWPMKFVFINFWSSVSWNFTFSTHTTGMLWCCRHHHITMRHKMKKFWFIKRRTEKSIQLICVKSGVPLWNLVANKCIKNPNKKSTAADIKISVKKWKRIISSVARFSCALTLSLSLSIYLPCARAVHSIPIELLSTLDAIQLKKEKIHSKELLRVAHMCVCVW